ncbi:MAG TPA: hypothetical protein VGO04_26680 [Ensifer sp.]|uniref:hypothetical protein n=1 Tax=Ensifer sp. TaxID=1872086 RepID=UPI002E0D9AF5|nr:hypothetical protein [Ensifer sp.]
MRRYASHPDPRVQAANVISLVVASNQPFYPLYLYWLVSDEVTPALFTFFSTPFFLAVPALARRQTVAGRALLPLAGIGNTVLCAWLFGSQSAVEVFYIPCAVIALLVFRPHERLFGLVLAGMAFGAYFLFNGRYGTPMVAYSADEYAALARLNALSASMLTGFVALVFSNALAEAEGSSKTVGDKKSG